MEDQNRNAKANRCILIGAGEQKTANIVTGKKDFIIAVDGGFDYCKKLGIVPDLIVGDFDSLKEESKSQLLKESTVREKTIFLPCEKDDTDMLFAVKEGLKRGFSRFEFYGATGGRLDHTIANIQTLAFLLEHGAEGMILEDGCKIWLLKNDHCIFGKDTTGMLSVFSFSEHAKGVSITGMKYPLDHVVVANSFPIGISNEFMGQEAVITVEAGVLLLILSSPTHMNDQY